MYFAGIIYIVLAPETRRIKHEINTYVDYTYTYYSHNYDYCQESISVLLFLGEGGGTMISYEPFWDTLKKKGMSTY